MDELRQRLRDKIEFLRQNRAEKETKKKGKKREAPKAKKQSLPEEKKVKTEEEPAPVETSKPVETAPTPSVNDVISKYISYSLYHPVFNLVRSVEQPRWIQVFVQR